MDRPSEKHRLWKEWGEMLFFWASLISVGFGTGFWVRGLLQGKVDPPPVFENAPVKAAPEHNYGWAGPESVEAAREWTEAQPKFQLIGPDGLPVVQDNERANVRLWELERLATGDFSRLPPQETGDCTALGAANAIARTQGAQAMTSGGTVKCVFPPFHYGMARYFISRQQWRPSRRGETYPLAGCSGASMAQACKDFGVISWDDAEAAGYKYSGHLADDWGWRGPPEKLKAIAAQHRVRTVSRLNTVEELRDAICNGFGCTEASGWGNPEERFETREGRIVAIHTGVWNHQMCIDGYDGSSSSGKKYFHVQNSHSIENSPTPVDGSPPGSWWVEWKDAEVMIAPKDSFAYSGFEGFPAQQLDLFSTGGPVQSAPDQNSNSRRQDVGRPSKTGMSP